MKAIEITKIVDQLKSLISNTNDIKANLCLKVFDSNFTLKMLWRTRQKQRQKWGNIYEEILITNNVKDEEFFRLFFIHHYDKGFSIFTNNDISEIFEISVGQGKFINVEIKPFVEDAYNEEVWATFINGELCISNFLFDIEIYERIKNNYKEIEGIWKNWEYIFHFEKDGILTHYDLIYFDLENDMDFQKFKGNWYLDKEDLIIQLGPPLNSFQYFKLKNIDRDNVEFYNIANNDKISLIRGNEKDIPRKIDIDSIEFELNI